MRNFRSKPVEKNIFPQTSEKKECGNTIIYHLISELKIQHYVVYEEKESHL